MSRFEKDDAAELTDVKISEVSEAWHEARDDAAAEGGWDVAPDRHDPDSSCPTSDDLGRCGSVEISEDSSSDDNE